MNLLNFIFGKIKCKDCAYGYDYQWNLYQKCEGITLTGRQVLNKGLLQRPPHCSISENGYCWWANCSMTPLQSWYAKKRMELNIKKEKQDEDL